MSACCTLNQPSAPLFDMRTVSSMSQLVRDSMILVWATFKHKLLIM